MRNTLISWGFYNTKRGSSLFSHKIKTTIIIILIYVDDILVTGSSTAELQKFTNRLNSMFSLKDLGNLHYFLRFEISRDETGMLLRSKKYIQDLLSKFILENISSSPTPMVAGKQFVEEE